MRGRCEFSKSFRREIYPLLTVTTYSLIFKHNINVNKIHFNFFQSEWFRQNDDYHERQQGSGENREASTIRNSLAGGNSANECNRRRNKVGKTILYHRVQFLILYKQVHSITTHSLNSFVNSIMALSHLLI